MYDDPPPARDVTAAGAARLERAARRRPRLLVAGPLAPGKEAMLRLLTEDCVPLADVWGPGLPPVVFTWGDPGADWIDGRGRAHPLPRGDLAATPAAARLVRIRCLSRTLDAFDLVTGAAPCDRRGAGMADLAVWIAPGAEAAAAGARAGLPPRLFRRTLLVATRPGAPAMPDADFAATLTVQPDAALAAAGTADPDAAAAAWRDSGAEALLAALGRIAARATRDREKDFARRTPQTRPSTDQSETCPMTDHDRSIARPDTAAPAETEAAAEARRTPRPTAADAADRMARLRAELAELSAGDGAPAARPAAEARPFPAAPKEAPRPGASRTISLFRRPQKAQATSGS